MYNGAAGARPVVALHFSNDLASDDAHSVLLEVCHDRLGSVACVYNQA